MFGAFDGFPNHTRPAKWVSDFHDLARHSMLRIDQRSATVKDHFSSTIPLWLDNVALG